MKAVLAKLRSPDSEPQKCSTLQTSRLRPLGTWDFSGAWYWELGTSFRFGPRANRTPPRRFLDRFSGRITQRQQHLFRAFGFIAAELTQRVMEGGQTKVGLACGAIHTVEKGDDVDQLRARVHKVEIQHLLPCHKSDDL